MTVIAWDGSTLAVDRQGTMDGVKFPVSKGWVTSTGEALAFAGSLAQGKALGEWFTAGLDATKWPEFQKDKDDWTVLVVANKHRCWFYERLPVPIYVESVFMAWGSGRDFALGAMAMGADAEEAVRIANRFSTGCGLGVDAWKVRQKA